MSQDNTPAFDWGAIAAVPGQDAGHTQDPSPAETGPVLSRAVNAPATDPSGAAFGSLPPFPAQTAMVVGRLPIQGDTGKAIIQLPEPVKDVHCAFTVANTGVLSDCTRTIRNACVPAVLRSRPLNDREFEVLLDGGDYTAKGAGWTPGTYPGAAPQTRSIDVGVPYVEILAIIGIDCGCSSENWASDNEWG